MCSQRLKLQSCSCKDCATQAFPLCGEEVDRHGGSTVHCYQRWEEKTACSKKSQDSVYADAAYTFIRYCWIRWRKEVGHPANQTVFFTPPEFGEEFCCPLWDDSGNEENGSRQGAE